MSGRPWFRPKHVGFGYTPQTWQGWAICFVPVIIFVIIATLLEHQH